MSLGADTLCLSCYLNRNVFYAFWVKCQRFVGLFGKPLMTPMLVSELK